MSLQRSAWVIFLGCLLSPSARAAETDPLKLVPAEADLVLKIEQPRKLVETITKLDALKALYQFEPFREVMESTSVKRFFQVVKYYERELGTDWANILDQVAGRGIVVAIRYGTYDGDYPAMLVMQGRDPDAVQKFGKLIVSVIEQEIARDDNAPKIERKAHRGADVVKFSSNFYLAIAGDSIIVTSQPKAMERVLEMRETGGASIADNASLQAAKKLHAKDPLAWLWYNFEPVKQSQMAKDLFAQPRNDTVLTIIGSAVIDVFKRSPFVSAGLYSSPEGIKLAMRLPAGMNGRAEETAIHLPPDGKSGTLPLLEPKGVILSHSFYFDFGALWDKREKVFNAETAAGFGELDAMASRFLLGTSVPKLFQQSGPYHRFMIVTPIQTEYKIVPKLKTGQFAFVTSMRDPNQGRMLATFIRGGVLLAAQQFKLKLVEFQHNGTKVVGYKFPEDGKLPEDTENIRFNFTPCFAIVNDQFITASTFELGRELIDLVKKEGKAPLSSSNMRMRLYAEGQADQFAVDPDQLLAQTILSQGVPVEEAKAQIQKLIAYLRTLGWIGIEYDYQPEYFEFAIQWKHK